MRREAEAYLCDILHACERISAYTAALDREGFEGAELIQDGVVLRLEIIGEALAQLRRHFPNCAGDLGIIQPIIEMRNYLVHQYHAVSTEIVWAVVQRDLPGLEATVRALLKGTGGL